MITNALKKVFGTRNERELKRMRKTVRLVNEQEAALQGLSDAELAARTAEFRERFADGSSLQALLPEAFAVVREAGKRTLGMRHFDVQLIGGMTLFEGRIAEMRTGEGKTLVATLPAYLNALSGKPVHLVTVNDYLARRDAQWMGPLYEFLGLSVGVIRSGQNAQEKREAYRCDVIYGTNNEFGFDYLRDNMAFSHAETDAQGRLELCHRRRGGLHPHRRGAHAVDHLRRLRGQLRAVQAHQPPDPLSWNARTPRKANGEGHFTVDEKAAPGGADRTSATNTWRRC